MLLLTLRHCVGLWHPEPGNDPATMTLRRHLQGLVQKCCCSCSHAKVFLHGGLVQVPANTSSPVKVPGSALCRLGPAPPKLALMFVCNCGTLLVNGSSALCMPARSKS